MLNRVSLVGRLTRDLELKNSVNSKPFVAFTLAVNNNFNNQASFIPCFAWNKTAENMARYLKKGSLIALDGRLQTRTDNVNGQVTTIVQVIADIVSFLDSKGTGANIGIPSMPIANDFNNTTFEQSEPQDDNNITFDGDDAILWD
ncbi:single-stranded DNA-binding protein [Spiroplasma citri]|uniref:Single-stranded DNA-binding protein n=1 Tax=Spiroplasma citri TaxID=2133 RepID=Q14QG0_SPICI|nr:single-stranded DNA-binding protein [Spiroplasma citri]APE73942.1 putative single-strand DNA-binding protein [Spiroplasma citri]QED23972.1 single-stranded DNA-binding protein [Spiroplasma citri]QIA66238.1 single-stranded DNA-binding protein [Spiroplasma citri]QIA68090.1 single-stranded DNA-binding protein [Spiroplasma citri]QIA69967.1 single-stranded DNA-binding protein [Spiroplasma citri]